MKRVWRAVAEWLWPTPVRVVGYVFEVRCSRCGFFERWEQCGPYFHYIHVCPESPRA